MERKPLPKPNAKKPSQDTKVIVAIVVGVGFVFVLVIGLLALIAIPKFSDYKRIQERARAEPPRERDLSSGGSAGSGGGSGGQPVTSAGGHQVFVGPDGKLIFGSSSGGSAYGGGGSASSAGGAPAPDPQEMARYRERREQQERARSERASRSRMSRSRRAGRSDPAAVMSRPIWAIKAFIARRGWISGPAAARLTGQPWGQRLAEAIEREIEARTQSAVVVPADFPEAELVKLTKQGLKYVVEGRLRSAKKSAEDPGQVALLAVYQLRRKMESGLKTVQVRSIRVQVPSAAGIDEGSLRDLIDAAAVKIAGHVMADIPADLLAQHG